MHDPILYWWILLWLTLGSYGTYILINIEDNKAASLYVYGKSLDLKNKKWPKWGSQWFWQLFLLPKRYFKHFYMTSLLAFITCFVVALLPFNQQFQSLFDRKLIKFESADSINSFTALLFTMILMIIQSARRLYETSFISVYSKDSKINIIHYLYGHVFYIMAAISTVVPILISQTSNKFTFTSLIDNLITKQRAIAFILFIYTSHQQQNCNKVLANLRKDKSGQVITDQHYVPSGGLFEYVSCPHFLTEVIIYFLILVAQEFKQAYWNLIFLLVLSTQTIKAIMEHRWYRRKYKDYSKERKAIFPRLL